MSKNKTTVIAQYFENYAIDKDGFKDKPYWKPKGSVNFEIEIDSDILMYTDVKKVFEKMIEKHNSIGEKFEYIDHAIQFSEPINLGTQEDYVKISQELKSEEPNHIIGGTDFSKSIEQLNDLSVFHDRK